MATPLGSAQHDLGSLRIHDGQRRGSKVGKGLAIFFGVLVILAGIGGGVYAFWNSKPVVRSPPCINRSEPVDAKLC